MRNPPPFGWKGLESMVLAEAGVELLPSDVIRVPFRDVDGTELNAKLWPRPPRRPWWEHSGRGVSLFGLEQLDRIDQHQNATIVICEGEPDALAVREAFAVDHDGAPVITLGVPGASAWQTGWAAHLRRFYRIYVAGDGDLAGHRLNQDVRGSMPWVRPLAMPVGMDCRDVIQVDGRDAFLELLDRADAVAMLTAALFKASNRAEAMRLLERWSA
jgi:hypothetical protein